MVNTENYNSQTIEGMLFINTMKKSFTFWKSLDIAAINTEIELLHLSEHEFWEEEETRAEFLEFLAAWCKIRQHISKRHSQLKMKHNQ